MNPVLQISLFTIALLISIFCFFNPEKILNMQYWWRIKGEKEYTKGYLMQVKTVSVVIGIVCVVAIIYGILAL